MSAITIAPKASIPYKFPLSKLTFEAIKKNQNIRNAHIPNSHNSFLFVSMFFEYKLKNKKTDITIIKARILTNDERYKKIQYFNSEEEALQSSDVCMILTDWPKFRTLGEVIKKVCPAPYLIMDGRRMLAERFDELCSLGYDIIAVGSPFCKGNK